MKPLELFLQEIDDAWKPLHPGKQPLHIIYADDLPKYVANLNRVERDYLGVEESEIELPSWV